MSTLGPANHSGVQALSTHGPIMSHGRSDRLRRLRGLYAITPAADAPDTRHARVAAVLTGGATVLQYRDKASSDGARLEQARALRKLAAQHAALFIVNDDPRLAAQVEADGVHLGQDDGDIASARALVGPDALIGVSCYGDLNLAQRAIAAGADYIAFGAAFASPTKPDAAHAPIALFQAARARWTLPIVAIGGIRPDNAPVLVDAGVDALAVISALFDAPDPQAAAAQFASFYR